MAGNANSGRRRKPPALKLIEGTASAADFAAQRGLEAALPVADPGMPPVVAADELARDEWARVVPLLQAMRNITEADRAELSGYCCAWADFCRARAAINAAGHLDRTPNGFLQLSAWSTIGRRAEERMRAAAQNLGLNPTARARVLARGQGELFPNEPADAVTRYFDR